MVLIIIIYYLYQRLDKLKYEFFVIFIIPIQNMPECLTLSKTQTGNKSDRMFVTLVHHFLYFRRTTQCHTLKEEVKKKTETVFLH